jgi:hypothetical protein
MAACEDIGVAEPRRRESSRTSGLTMPVWKRMIDQRTRNIGN